MENQQGYNEEFEIQKRIAFTAGLLQGDVTIKTLLESLAEGVIFINESGQIILINKRMSEMTGYERQEVTGQQIDVFIPADLREKHRRHLKDFFLKPKIRSMGIGMELTARRKDDSTFPVEVSISYLTTESGMLGIGFVTDITDRKKAEKELKDRNIALDEYAHTVAHDLKASLSGIIGYAE
ncbi:MAG: PAS domain S-box protein, partial [Bacteroidales bacterium]